MAISARPSNVNMVVDLVLVVTNSFASTHTQKEDGVITRQHQPQEVLCVGGHENPKGVAIRRVHSFIQMGAVQMVWHINIFLFVFT